MKPFAELVETLNSFHSARDVADFLEAQGVRTARRGTSHCPIARYLQNNGYPNAMVGTSKAYSMWTNSGLPLSDAAQLFIAQFDCNDDMFPVLRGRTPLSA